MSRNSYTRLPASVGSTPSAPPLWYQRHQVGVVVLKPWKNHDGTTLALPRPQAVSTCSLAPHAVHQAPPSITLVGTSIPIAFQYCEASSEPGVTDGNTS